MKTLGLLLTLISPLGLAAQKEIAVGGMQLKYELVEEAVEIELAAPTTGWLGVGFNSKNDIVDSDLLLFHVIDEQGEFLDMHVVGVGNPKKDVDLGGFNNIEILSFEESSSETKIRFKRPLVGDAKLDFQHEEDKTFWLIMAYSTHDDFGHHSRMRKHVPFSFAK
ncbi:MAG: DOMON domain-containing protein [Bacteroidota bacterium]